MLDWLASHVVRIAIGLLWLYIIGGGAFYIALADTWRERAKWMGWTVITLAGAEFAERTGRWAASAVGPPGIASLAAGVTAFGITFGISMAIIGMLFPDR